MSRPHIQQKLSASNLYDDEPLPPPPLNYRPPQVTTTSQPSYPQPQNNGFHHGHQTVPATNASTPSADGSDLVQAMGGMHVGQQHQVPFFLNSLKHYNKTSILVKQPSDQRNKQ
jgi:hypothetical protein